MNTEKKSKFYTRQFEGVETVVNSTSPQVSPKTYNFPNKEKHYCTHPFTNYDSASMECEVLERPILVLHLEDSATDHELARIALNRSGLQFTLCRVDSLAEFQSQLAEGFFDIVVADYRLSGFTALEAWGWLRQSHRPIPFVLLSGAIGELAAVDALHLGISDYLPKESMNRLPHVLQRALEVNEARKQREIARQELATSQNRLAQLAEHLQTSIEAERASIAREIHDDIGGSLAAIRFDLAWLDRHNNDPASQQHIASASDMLQHAIGASQRIMMNLRPAVLEEGLLPALQWLITSFEKRTEIAASCISYLKSTPLPPSIELVAYRFTQEALTNISKYSKANKVLLEISDAEQTLTIEINDNGVGFDTNILQITQGFGLKGLLERAKTVGGWLDISSTPTKGTSLVLSIPLHGNITYKSLTPDSGKSI